MTRHPVISASPSSWRILGAIAAVFFLAATGCSGSDGKNGAAGKNGSTTLITLRDEPVGVNCAAGPLARMAQALCPRPSPSARIARAVG